MTGRTVECVAAEPSPDDLAREVMELRAAVAALTEVARDVDARALALEHRLRAVSAAQPVGAIAPATPVESVTAASRAVTHAHGHGHGHARAASMAVTAGTRAAPPSGRGRHRSRDPEVVAKERSAQRRNAVVTVAMMLPWLLCIGLFAIALGLVAVSTFQ